MSKIFIGDYVIDEYGHKGHVVECRGGYVGRWRVKGDDGQLRYKSSRDLTVLVPVDASRPQPTGRRLSVNDKLDLLFDYLGIEIEDTPRIVKRSNDGEVSRTETTKKLTKEN